MKTLNMIVLAVSLAFSANAMAHSMSKSDYKAGKDFIAAEYKSDKAGCVLLSGNPDDSCVAEAKAKETTARAELDASYKAHYQTLVGKTAETAAKADARAQTKTSEANDTSNEKSAEARGEGNSPAQACAANMQALVAIFHANFLQHAN